MMMDRRGTLFFSLLTAVAVVGCHTTRHVEADVPMAVEERGVETPHGRHSAPQQTIEPRRDASDSAPSSEQRRTSVERQPEGPRGGGGRDEPVTALDQSERKDDRELTRMIRRALMEDGSLSFAAKNITIVTSEGRVTLQGRVSTAAERATILQKAKAIAGPEIDDRLEVASSR